MERMTRPSFQKQTSSSILKTKDKARLSMPRRLPSIGAPIVKRYPNDPRAFMQFSAAQEHSSSMPDLTPLAQKELRALEIGRQARMLDKLREE